MSETNTPVESGNQPLVMDALSIARSRTREVQQPPAAPAPLPESTQAESPVVPASTETQEPAATPVSTEPVATEVKTEESKPETPKPSTDWRRDAYYQNLKKLEDQGKELAELRAKLAAPAKTPEPIAAAPTEEQIVVPTWDPAKFPDGYDSFLDARDKAVIKLAKQEGAAEAKRLFEVQAATTRQDQTARIAQDIEAQYRQRILDHGLADYAQVVAASTVKFSPQNTQLVNEILLNDPLGPKMAYHLAKNPQEIIRIDGLSKLDQYAAFSELRAKVQTPAHPGMPPASAPAPVHPGVSKAPPPIKTIKTGSTTPVRLSDSELAKLSPEEYQAAHPEIIVHRGIHSKRMVSHN